MGSQRSLGRWLLLGVIAAAIGAYFAFDLGRFLSFESLNSHKDSLLNVVADTPVVSAAVFMLVYVSVTALSLPVATALTLLAGALFGRLLGTVLVNISATTGATLAFLAARYLFGDWAQERMSAPSDPGWDPDGPKARRARARRAAWHSAGEGIRASGLNYLLVLRLIPIVPFFLINLVSGLSPLRVRTFIFGTLVGTLPGTFLYVNAGMALGTLSKPSDLLSAQVLGALGLLALFSLIPVAWRRWRSA